eukprot:SAG22_NODE_3305_length_1791_cov_1.262411_2_plen_214_part_00
MWKGRVGFKNPEIVAAYPGGGFAVPAGALGFSVTGECSSKEAIEDTLDVPVTFHGSLSLCLSLSFLAVQLRSLTAHLVLPAVFCVCQTACLLTLIFRRSVFGAELGNRHPGATTHTKVTSIFMALLWFTYVTMSVLQTYEIVDEGLLMGIVGGGGGLFVVVMLGLKGVLGGKYDTSEEYMLGDGSPRLAGDGGQKVDNPIDDEVENPVDQALD